MPMAAGMPMLLFRHDLLWNVVQGAVARLFHVK